MENGQRKQRIHYKKDMATVYFQIIIVAHTDGDGPSP